MAPSRRPDAIPFPTPNRGLFRPPPLLLALLLVVFPMVFGACDSSSPTDNDGDAEPNSITVDASEDWVYVTLGETFATRSIVDPTTSNEWSLAFNATAVTLNGGDAGPGGVQGYCVCNNQGISDTEVMDLTDEDGLASFEAVTAADIPSSEDDWIGDALNPAISGWYSYDPDTHVVSANPDAVYNVRTAEGVAFAKLHITDIVDPQQAHAGQVTLEFATQSAAGATLGPIETVTVDLSAAPAYVDLVDAAETDASDWDLLLDGYTIRVNGGVSGEGDAGAVQVEQDFEAIADPSGSSEGAYAADAFGGVFASEEPGTQWYRYNLDGLHQIWPTQNVYLIRRDSEVFKIQLTGYYSETGDSRHITIRYAPLTGEE